MRVIYILDIFPKISETFILNEILELQRQKVDVVIFALKQGNISIIHSNVKDIKRILYLKKASLWKNFKCHFYYLVKRPFKYVRICIIILKSKSHLGRMFLTQLHNVRDLEIQGPDRLHAHFGWGGSDFSLLCHLLTGIPFTFTMHGSDIFIEPQKNLVLKTKFAKKLITISDYNKKYLVERLGLDQNKIAVVRCGIDLQKFSPREYSISENIIVCVGRLEKVKGIDLLIQACNLLKKEEVDFKCYILGDGKERGNLENMIKEFALEHQVFLEGNKSQEQVFGYLGKAKLKVLSSRSESMGVALMEALAMGIPVVGPNIYGVPELIIDKKNGLLFTVGDYHDLYIKIRKFLVFPPEVKFDKLFALNIITEKFDLSKNTALLKNIWESD